MTPEFAQRVEKIRMGGGCAGCTGGACSGCPFARLQREPVVTTLPNKPEMFETSIYYGRQYPAEILFPYEKTCSNCGKPYTQSNVLNCCPYCSKETENIISMSGR